MPTAAVLRRYHANSSLLPEGLRPPFRGTVDEQRARKWIARWRSRWGGFYGKAPVREPLMSVEDTLAKAQRCDPSAADSSVCDGSLQSRRVSCFEFNCATSRSELVVTGVQKFEYFPGLDQVSLSDATFG